MWFPRPFQGRGRHDNPDAFGCLYCSESSTAPVVELLARFTGRPLTAEMLRLRGFPLALAELELRDDTELVDLDEPHVLLRERLRPSLVATRQREVTQPQALELHGRHDGAAGLRWWSTYESLWANVTLFDRAASRLRVRATRVLALDDGVVGEAAELLGLATPR